MARRSSTFETEPTDTFTEESYPADLDEPTEDGFEAVPEETDEEAVPVTAAVATPDPEDDEPTGAGPVPEAAAKAEKPEPDFTAFNQATENAIEARDTATGAMPVEVIEKVVIEFRALDGGLKSRNLAKKMLMDGVKLGMGQSRIDLARAYMSLSDAVNEAKTTSTGERVPLDPTEAFINQVAALNIAYNLVSGAVPENVSSDWSERSDKLVADSDELARAYLAWVKSDAETRGEEPDTSAIVRTAIKYVQGKSAKAPKRAANGSSAKTTYYTGDRRNIAEHIKQAFENVPSGTFKLIAEIRSSKSTEYGDDLPSAGAISDRLFPKSKKCTLDFVRPGTNDAGYKGAYKV